MKSAALTETLKSAYGITPDQLAPIQAGTDTVNYRVTDTCGAEWFAKVYRKSGSELAAVELAAFVRDGGVPVPELRPTSTGDLIATGGVRMSLWEYVLDARTAEDGIAGKGWESIGTTMGIMHRRLARHPLAKPRRRPGPAAFDIGKAAANYARLIAEYEIRSGLDPFERWALGALRARSAALPRVSEMIRSLPELTTQVLHGDLAAPNVLLRGDAVAAIIDFQPPAAQLLPWEIARIGCDPRTVVDNPDWPAGLVRLSEAYRQENPVPEDDLRSVVACGAAYTLLSAYPLAEPIKSASPMDASLRRYAYARHESAFHLLAAAEAALR
ncbi:MAG TPA: phosphotransferase [Mycobacteriales bacterium]|nr:phosphotransferase [Mycobacteriales bacterium]